MVNVACVSQSYSTYNMCKCGFVVLGLCHCLLGLVLHNKGFMLTTYTVNVCHI